MNQLLEIRDLTTRFFTPEGTVHALNSISFRLAAGESMALVGESGSGKSVTALSIMGLLPRPAGRITAGQILFKGQDLRQLSEQEMQGIRGREIAMIFQDPMTSLNPVLTIGRQLTESLKLHLQLNNKQAQERAKELLSLVGIPNQASRLNDYPYQFSGGQRQRVMIAMALSCNPSLLIADEPTTALDVTIQAQIVNLVKQLGDQLGMAIIWITHDMGVVAGLVDKVIVMYGGTIAEQAPVRELYRHPSHPYTLGLLESLPKVDAHQQQRLQPIEGLPPDMLQPPQGCPFAPRCRFVIAQCQQEMPPLFPAGAYHTAACWQWENVQNSPRK